MFGAFCREEFAFLFYAENQRQESEQQAGHTASLCRPTLGDACRRHERQAESRGECIAKAIKRTILAHT